MSNPRLLKLKWHLDHRNIKGKIDALLTQRKTKSFPRILSFAKHSPPHQCSKLQHEEERDNKQSRQGERSSQQWRRKRGAHVALEAAHVRKVGESRL
jgi:hypothetical protein